MSPRDTGAANMAATPTPAPTPTFELSAILAQQQRIGEAWAASGQKFLEGLQEIAQRSALLQTAMMQQALTGWASVTAAAGRSEPSEDTTKQATAAAEATIASLRDVMDAACKCHTEALAAFQQRMATAVELR